MVKIRALFRRETCAFKRFPQVKGLIVNGKKVWRWKKTTWHAILFFTWEICKRCKTHKTVTPRIWWYPTFIWNNYFSFNMFFSYLVGIYYFTRQVCEMYPVKSQWNIMFLTFSKKFKLLRTFTCPDWICTNT